MGFPTHVNGFQSLPRNVTIMDYVFYRVQPEFLNLRLVRVKMKEKRMSGERRKEQCLL